VFSKILEDIYNRGRPKIIFLVFSRKIKIKTAEKHNLIFGQNRHEKNYPFSAKNEKMKKTAEQ